MTDPTEKPAAEEPTQAPASETPEASDAPDEAPSLVETGTAPDAAPNDTPTYPRVRFETTQGEIVIELWEDVAPRHADNFNQLIHDGFYDGLTFHRIIPEFLIQSGCPIGDGTGTAGWDIDAEFNERKHEPGVVSMARRKDPDSASSQFFICLSRENCEHLDGQYTAFGRVVEGMDTVERIATTPLLNEEDGTPIDPPQITNAYDYYHDDYGHDPYYHS
ncbi:MAG: peptidylprolyl isomerase, partial [Planctomycetota bacterium]